MKEFKENYSIAFLEERTKQEQLNIAYIENSIEELNSRITDLLARKKESKICLEQYKEALIVLISHFNDDDED